VGEMEGRGVRGGAEWVEMSPRWTPPPRAVP